MRRLIVAAAMAIVVAPFLTGTAQAVSGCAWDQVSATLTVDVEGVARLAVSGSAIVLDENPCDAGATTTTVEQIVVTGSAGLDLFFLDLRGGSFAPGATVESGASEIEMTIDLGGGVNDFTLTGTSGPDSFSFGTGGANLNGDNDVDATIAGLGDLTVYGNSGADAISASGGVVVGGPVTTYFVADGDADNDIVIGGDGDDLLSGGEGQDLVRGGRGADDVRGGAGADELRGGAGVDTVNYLGASGGVTVSLRNGTASGGGQGFDQLGTFENVAGSYFADILVGNEHANTLAGYDGNDTLAGLSGADRLWGLLGQDKLNGGYGPDRLVGGDAHDVLRGGPGGDTLLGRAGNDLLHGNGGNDALNGGFGTDTCYQERGSGPKTSCERPAFR